MFISMYICPELVDFSEYLTEDVMDEKLGKAGNLDVFFFFPKFSSIYTCIILQFPSFFTAGTFKKGGPTMSQVCIIYSY